MNATAGLLAPTTGTGMALDGVDVTIAATDRFARTTIVQRFHNHEAVAVEAVYVFPLDPDSAVCGFRARIRERVVVAKVYERDEAFERYDDALAAGHGAFLLDQERPDVFTCSLGAFAFARLQFPGRDTIFWIYLSTLMLPEQVTLIPLFFIMKNFGWIDKYQGLTIPFIVTEVKSTSLSASAAMEPMIVARVPNCVRSIV